MWFTQTHCHFGKFMQLSIFMRSNYIQLIKDLYQLISFKLILLYIPTLTVNHECLYSVLVSLMVF